MPFDAEGGHELTPLKTSSPSIQWVCRTLVEMPTGLQGDGHGLVAAVSHSM
jgi:hypothetical protein